MGSLVGTPYLQITAGFTKGMSLFNVIHKCLLKHFSVEETPSKPMGAVARQSLLCLFIFAFPVTGSLAHPGQRINLSDPSISSCKSAVCYWGWFTTMPILVIISCNYECISQKRKANGKMWRISVYVILFLCAYKYLWDNWWIREQEMMQYWALPWFHNMGHIIARNSCKWLCLPCSFVSFLCVFRGLLQQTTLKRFAFNSMMNSATIDRKWKLAVAFWFITPKPGEAWHSRGMWRVWGDSLP